jgi:anhydro-N-acetylmuramic acid kinase
MSLLRTIGLMSGTSMDGVDVALLETDGQDVVRQGPSLFRPYGIGDRRLLRAAMAEATHLEDRSSRPGVIAECERMVTRRHAEAVDRFLENRHFSRESIDLIGFHGQTILHRPAQGLTVQIGDGQELANRVGIPVAYDFRAADVAAGGEGAPLVPVFHRALVEGAGMEGPVALLNIGGVANLTFIDDGHDPIACDTGPGNALLDDLMLEATGKAMDEGGQTAAKGWVDEALIRKLMHHPFFEKNAPKSLDRNDFTRDDFAHLSVPNQAATLTAFTAAAVSRALELMPKVPKYLIVCGGGARNPVMLMELESRTRLRVTTAEARGWSVDAMEAQAFAYLAARCLKGLPITFPTTTGVKQALCGGVLVQPADARRPSA